MDLINTFMPKYWDNLAPLSSTFGVLGVLTHMLYFVHGNHNKKAFSILLYHLAAATTVFASLIKAHGARKGIYLSMLANMSYLFALFGSMTVYRIWFHPLARFPGPLAAKITKFYGPWIARNGRMHLEHSRILDTYCDISRIGPNELLLRSTDAIRAVHGSNSRCNKTDTFYEFINWDGVHNLDSIPNREVHRHRRRIWDTAMGSKAQARYEIFAREVTSDWHGVLDSVGDRPINTSLYAFLIPFDNIGKVGYSHNFHAVKTGVEPRLVHFMESMFKAAGQLGQLAWPLGILQKLGLDTDVQEFHRLIKQLVDKRIEDDSEDKEDIIKYLLEDLQSPSPKAFFEKTILYSDATAIMVGGTDTIAALLSYAFYELGRSPSLREKLRKAVGSVYRESTPGGFSDKDLEGVKYLEAFINEILRMYNPVCNNGQRTTPDDGIIVDGQFIPGGTQMIIPVHSMHRYSKFFRQPDEFIVERWTTRRDLIVEERAFHPFLVGSLNCVGKRLALCLVRHVLASTIWNYDFEFAPGETGEAIHKEALNQLILKAGPLHCVFRKRDDSVLV